MHLLLGKAVAMAAPNNGRSCAVLFQPLCLFKVATAVTVAVDVGRFVTKDSMGLGCVPSVSSV